MKKNIIKTIATLTFAVSSCYANATSYDFSYTFNDGKILSGSLTGTLQSNLDSIFVSTIDSVTYDSIVFPGSPVFPTSNIGKLSELETTTSSQAVVSFSGDNMDLFACSSGAKDPCNRDLDYGFAINSTASGFAFNSIFGKFETALFGAATGNFSSNNWSLQESMSSVPVPAAAWLFASSLVGLLGLRRKNVSI